MDIPKFSRNITPLGIIAAFVSLTEIALCYAVTKVSGNVQIALTTFAIVFAILVFCAFFAILWNRPYVFYPPSEYGGTDPKNFVAAVCQGLLPREQVQLVESACRNPGDKQMLFPLIDSMLDEVHRQFIILMHVVPCDLPYSEFSSRMDIFEMEYGAGSASTGAFPARIFVTKLEGTNFVSLSPKGPTISLTQDGHAFAQWLIDNGKKATCMKSRFGGWGEPQPDGFIVRHRQGQPPSPQKAV